MHNKLILTDCDGVLLDWEYHFNQWMIRNGHELVNEVEYNIALRYNIDKQEARRLGQVFNEHASIAFLSPFKDSIKYIRKLHEDHGYIFHVITSQTKDPYAQRLRRKNLKYVFGHNIFEKIICLDYGADKDEELSKYKDSGCWWIEDKPENADVGITMGLRSILLEHNHNRQYKGEAYTASNWKQIYDIINWN